MFTKQTLGSEQIWKKHDIHIDYNNSKNDCNVETALSLQKSHKNIYIYIYVVTKNHGFCKILIARYQYIKCEVMYDTVYIFFKRKSNKTKFKTICRKSNMPSNLAMATVTK